MWVFTHFNPILKNLLMATNVRSEWDIGKEDAALGKKFCLGIYGVAER